MKDTLSIGCVVVLPKSCLSFLPFVTSLLVPFLFFSELGIGADSLLQILKDEYVVVYK